MVISRVLTHLARHLQRRVEAHRWRYHLFLTHDLAGPHLLEGYKALARLIYAGVFSTILTANADTLLESALEGLGLHPPQYQVFVVRQDSDERVAAALEEPFTSGIRIIKLYSNAPASPSDAIRQPLSIEVQKALLHYFSKDIVIFGFIGREEDCIQALHPCEGRSVYYVVPELPTVDDIIVRIMHMQGELLDDFLISGEVARFAAFFRAIEESIQGGGLSMKRVETALPSDFTSQPVTSQTHPLIEPEVPIRQLLALPLTARPFQESKSRSVPGLPAGSASQLVSFVSPSQHTGSTRFDLAGKGHADVLLVTVTDIEAQAVFDLFPGYRRKTLNGRIYYDLGLVGGARTFMVQSAGMGPIGSRNCIEEGILALTPQVVIMVGIAFGLHPEKQQLGDILVSQQIEDYDHQKISTGPGKQRLIYPRGNRVAASERLLNRFRAGKHDWSDPPRVYFGLILSGSKVVNHESFRDELLQIAPEAIGGEMEGAALCEVGMRKGVEWILIKAICDWADGTKNDASQKLAAENAVHFVIHVMQQDGFIGEGLA